MKEDNKRPDGTTLLPWKMCVLVKLTYFDIFCCAAWSAATPRVMLVLAVWLGIGVRYGDILCKWRLLSSFIKLTGGWLEYVLRTLSMPLPAKSCQNHNSLQMWLQHGINDHFSNTSRAQSHQLPHALFNRPYITHRFQDITTFTMYVTRTVNIRIAGDSDTVSVIVLQ